MWRELRAMVKVQAAFLAAKRWPRCTPRVPPPHSPNTTATAIGTFSSSVAFSRNLPKSPTLLSHRFSFLRLFSSSNLAAQRDRGEFDGTGEEEESDDWEEEKEVEPEIGDGGDGGGIVLGDVAWGERALSVAREVVLQIGGDMDLHAFKVSPKGFISVRLDKLTNKYGCPSMEEIENFSNVYKERLDEIGECGEIPDDLGLQVSSPGAERLLRIPDDLDRFRDVPMWVSYLEENPDPKHHQNQPSEKVLLLDSVDIGSQQCVWKLANVRENRDVQSKGRPMSRKQKDWRLTLHFESIKRVTMYLDSKSK